jgi:hypothetical protein
VRIAAEVTNFGAGTARDLTLQIQRSGQILRRRDLPPIAPGESVSSTISMGFSSPGVQVLEARVLGDTEDALGNDDARLLSFEVRDVMPVLLVDGRPGASPLAGQAGFLATALAPAIPADTDMGVSPDVPQLLRPTLIAPKVIGDPELDGEALGDYDVVALCNVQRLSAEQWERLKKFVSRGGGLFVFLGELVAVDNYNRYGYAEGKALLPGRLGRMLETPADEDASTSFAGEDLTHEVVAEFRDQPNSGLFSARVDRYLPLELDFSRAEVVMRYADGAPALVVSDHGRGRVLTCTTTANMDWTNLPAKGDYVSLMLNAFAYVSPRRGDHRNVTVGQPLREQLAPSETSMPLRITTAAGETAEGRLVPVDDTLAVEYGPVRRTGVLKVSIGAREVRFASNVDPLESDLPAADEQAFIKALDRPVSVVSDVTAVTGGPATARSSELAFIALYLVIALLLGEMVIALWFGSSRTAG